MLALDAGIDPTRLSAIERGRVIGPASGCADVVHAFGHGHIGLAAGATTGRLVADLVSGLPPVIDPAPYSAARFR